MPDTAIAPDTTYRNAAGYRFHVCIVTPWHAWGELHRIGRKALWRDVLLSELAEKWVRVDALPAPAARLRRARVEG